MSSQPTEAGKTPPPTPGPSSEHPSCRNEIWQTAIDRYYDELAKSGVPVSTIDKDIWNIEGPDQVVKQVKSLAAVQAIQNSKLESILHSLNDFVMLTAWAVGMNGKVAAVLWGSIRLIIKFAKPVLPAVIEMLQQLQQELPQIHMYEEELPRTTELEAALSDLYREIIVFCAHAIAVLHNNPNINLNERVWSRFRDRDFEQVIGKVGKSSRRVHEVADMIRLSKKPHTAETRAALAGSQDLQVSKGSTSPCYMIPYGLNLRFFGRDVELQRLKDTLDPSTESARLRAIGVYGLGGVGKSQLALQYANVSMESYNTIAWIPAETEIKLVQAVSNLAVKLGLTDTASEGGQSVQKVRDWLNQIKQPFLLIFDNVEDAGLLQQIWPANKEGSIIITTRSPLEASRRTTETLHLKSFTHDTAKDALEALVGRKPGNDEEEGAMREICRLVGGLPLAMAQISDFICGRDYSYREFLSVYEKSAEKVFAKSDRPVEYDHTLLTTYDISLQKLSTEATALLNLLAFFDPDSIPERLLANIAADLDGTQYEFLLDKFNFGEAAGELTRNSMITRLSSSKALSMHRLVQLVVLHGLPTSARVETFGLAVRLLYFGFPNTWQGGGAHQGHGWASWEQSSEVLPHVSLLMRLSEKYKIKTPNTNLWAELFFRAGTYLWEKDQPAFARSFFEFGLEIDSSQSGRNVAQAYRLLGHVSLDLAQPRAALAAYERALALREQIEAPESPPIADVCDSIACAYTEAGDVESAFAQLERATAIHKAHDPTKMSRTLAIRAMTCLRAGQAEEALAAIGECWRQQNMTQDQIETSRYPKHSGDIMLLARIFWLQGKKAEAQELASRTITMRQGIFGKDPNKGGPRVADSLFTVARMLDDRGDAVLAAKLLRQVIDMCGDVPGMRPHLARALWFNAAVEEKIGKAIEDVPALRARARDVRGLIQGREWPDEDSDEGFMRLVGWMLW